MQEKLTRQVTIRVSAKMEKQLKKLAMADKRRLSDFCRLALEEYIEQYE